MGPDAMILIFGMLSFKPTFSLSSFTFIKRLFCSSLLSFFCCKSCRTLAPWPGSEPAPPALRGEVLNTEPLKKSLHKGLNEDALSEAVCFCCLIKSPDSWWETQDGEESRIEPWQPSILWYNFIDSFTTLLWGQLSVLHNSRVTKNVCKETDVS